MNRSATSLRRAARPGIERDHPRARRAGPGWRAAGRRRRPAHDLGDRVEREPEHVVEHERRALGGGEAVEDDGERQPHLRRRA